MTDLIRRLLCRAGRHHVIRCAGAVDHLWTWTGDRWHAEITPGQAWTSPLARVTADQQVRALRPPADKNDHGRSAGHRSPR